MIARIRETLHSGAETTRTGLSRRVCEWLNWRNFNGQLREIDARKALVALEREGLIELPGALLTPPQHRSTQPPQEDDPAEVSFEGTLEQLGEVTLVAVTARQVELSRTWRALLERDHPLGSGPLCGAQQRYLIHSETVGWIGALAFSAAAWHLKARDEFIGWSAKTRRANLRRVVSNSRFLLRAGIRVRHLASYVLGLAARQVMTDWPQRYGYAPVLLESFVDESAYAGTSYRAANWQRLGETAGRGRQDRDHSASKGIKAIYVLPLQADWRRVLSCVPARPLRLAPPAGEQIDWATHELGRMDVVDGRLRERAVRLLRDFYAQPLAPIAQACGGDPAKTKAAYRFLSNSNVDLDSVLTSHIEATATRMQAYPVVLSVQDTTSLNYDAHGATRGLGPINTQADDAQGLKLHDTLAFTPQGVPLGIIDAQCWAREAFPPEPVKAAKRRRKVEETEALRWITSYVQSARLQALLPATRVVCVADREADIYELFAKAQTTPDGPDLLIRANRSRARRIDSDRDADQDLLWDHVQTQPEAGSLRLQIPGKGGRKARIADLQVRYTPVKLKAPRGHKGNTLSLWAVQALESSPPPDTEAVQWLLLTTVATETFEQATERLSWYAVRWSIEVFHRTLKSGCRIEDRRLADAGNLQACLALDMIVAWRVLYLTHLGRNTPDVPCDVFFEEEEWKALCAYQSRNPTPPTSPPTLGAAMRMVAQIGGFLGRKGDGNPGATVIWRGLDKLSFITDTFRLFHAAAPNGP